MNWAKAEEALFTWFKQATGLSTLVWGMQNIAEPSAYPYGVLALGDMQPANGPDEMRLDYDASRDLGEEVRMRVTALRTFTLSAQVFTSGTTGGTMAMALASKAQAALALPTVQDSFHAWDFACLDAGSVRNLSGLIRTDIAGRALLEPRFLCFEEAQAFTSYITQVEGSADIAGGLYPFTLGGPEQVEE